MKWYTYDAEVFKHDFIMGFKDKETGEYYHFHNDIEGIQEFVDEHGIYCGFNTKHYDSHILKAIAGGFSPEEVKAVNDWVVTGKQGWQCPLLEGIYYRFNNVDIMDDMQMGLSLKAIEGHLGMNIEETDVDFNIDRPLTPDEIALVIKYNKADLDATEKVTEIRKDYLKNKIYLGGMKGISPTKSLAMTNAKLCAAYLDAKRTVDYKDERSYKYPENLCREYIPQNVFDFFNRLYDTSISDDELFKSKLNILVGDCPVTLGFGGIHGALPFHQEEEKKGRLIRNYDVASYYPHLMVYYGYTSRNIPNPGIYANMLKERMKAKKAGDMATANALKLVANTTYGAMLNKYNDLFDPLMGRSVCITGQLFLLELSQHLIKECSSLRVVQLNTDGIMVSFDESEYEKVQAITKEWEQRTRFELEEDKIKRIVQKDVNNYVEIPYEGKPKIKGGYLVRGIAPAGAFNVNNNATIIAKAIVEYFVNGTPVEETIGECDDIFAFQIIAKAGAKYKEAYHLVDGEKIPVQKVNRVYATTNPRYGKIYKVKHTTVLPVEHERKDIAFHNQMVNALPYKSPEEIAKIESLPDHCIIDNDNHLTIADIDKTFYIELAKKRINDYMGIKPVKKGRKKMAETKTTKTKNVYQKLLEARIKFLASNPSKSGMNMHMSFKYFELDDIVPIANKIFEDVGLISITNFTNDTATMIIVNTENPDENIFFSAPFNQLQPIVSNTGKQATNEMQALGSSITYMRRYLYMIALDICEPDTIDPSIGDTTTLNTAPVVKQPVENTTSSPLTDSSGQASDLQIKQMKELLKQLREADPAKEEWIAQIAVDTSGFKVISKAECENLVKEINAYLEGGEE